MNKSKFSKRFTNQPLFKKYSSTELRDLEHVRYNFIKVIYK